MAHSLRFNFDVILCERFELKYTISIIFTLLITVSSLKAETSVDGIGLLVTKASEYYFESSLDNEESSLLDGFDASCQKLDSLLGIYMPLDTVSGTTGDERVWRIAECYTAIGMYEKARDWWMTLRRNDDDGIFRMENNKGLLKTAVALADTNLIIHLLGEVELWDMETKKKAANELVSAIEFLYLQGTDIKWLHKRFTRISRFLDPVESEILRARLLVRKGEFADANSICRKLVAGFQGKEWKAREAKYLLELYFSSSVLEGRFEDAEMILENINIYGCGQLTARARQWAPSISMLRKMREKAEKEYSQICMEYPTSTGPCFWKDFMIRYKEILSDARK